MEESAELPEYQIFHVLRHGEQESIGPFSQNELVVMLNSEEIKATDRVFYPELTGWKKLSDVFDLHQKISDFGDEGQDPKIVSDTFAYINGRSEPDENIYYIAVQEFPALSLTAAVHLSNPKSIVLTDHRFCILNPRLMGGTELSEYPLDQIEGTLMRVKPDQKVGVFVIVLRSGDWIETDKIPADQLNHMEHVAASILMDSIDEDE